MASKGFWATLFGGPKAPRFPDAPVSEIPPAPEMPPVVEIPAQETAALTEAEKQARAVHRDGLAARIAEAKAGLAARSDVPSLNHFFAIDVETANAALDSICQIGLVEFRDGVEVGAHSWLIDPDDEFDEVNVAIHGITRKMVRGKPGFGVTIAKVRAIIGGSITVCHTHFDRVALAQACALHRAEPLSCRWLDSARVVRRTWDDFAYSGYGLANVAAFLSITFRHHDALEDARTAGLIVLRAIDHSGFSLHDWLERVERGISERQDNPRRSGNEHGPLAGERIVFTGSLDIERWQAADMADALGAAVDPGVTKKTTMLIVGNQDLKLLAGHPRSKKHRHAEDLIAKGKAIRILRQDDWQALHTMFG